MAGFKDVWNQLFGKGRDIPSNQPILHELIERTEEELKAYEGWKHSDRQSEQLEYVFAEYHKEREAKNLLGSTFYYLDEPSSKGFMLNYQPDIFKPAEFQYYFDYLKERVQGFDYKIYTSDVRSFVREEYAEEVQRHYLKPRNRMDQNQLDQQFGNITITLVKQNNQPVYIQFICHRYHDRNYTEATDYRNLIEQVIH